MSYSTSGILKHSGQLCGAVVSSSIEAIMIAGIAKIVCDWKLLGHTFPGDVPAVVVMLVILFTVGGVAHRHILWFWTLLTGAVIAVVACMLW